MGQIVTTQDGQTHIFPDEATPEMIAGALGVQPPAAQAPQQQVVPNTGLERVGQGIEDIPNGIAQLALHAGGALGSDAMEGGAQYLDQDLSRQEKQYQAARTAAGDSGMDLYRMGGNVVGGAPIAAALPGAAAETAVGRFGAGMLNGATSAASMPALDAQNGGYWTDKAYQTAGGAATGGVLNPMLGGFGAAISPKIDPAAKSLMDEGITPTIGQILGGRAKTTEEKLTSIPLIGDAISNAYGRGLEQFNNVALNRALEPIGETTTKIGRDGIDEVATKLGDAYNKVLPNLSLNINQNIAQGVANAGANLPTTEAMMFNDILQKQFNKYGGLNGTLTGDQIKSIESELGNMAKGYRGDASYDKKQLGTSISGAQDVIRTELANQNPTFGPQLQAINQGYANFARLRGAASAVKEDGPFTPNQLASAIRQQDKSAGKGQFARGNAMMQDLSDPAVGVLANKFPESGTFARHAIEAAAAGLLGHSAGASPETMLAGGTAAALGSLPYLTPTTQKIAAALLTKRPPGAGAVSDFAQSMAPFVSAGAAGYSQR